MGAHKIFLALPLKNPGGLEKVSIQKPFSWVDATQKDTMSSPINYRQAFESAFVELRKPLWYFILHKMPREEAEDLFQTVCLQAFEAFQSMKDTGKLKALIFTIARRRIKDFYRRPNRFPVQASEMPLDKLVQGDPFSAEQRLYLKAIPEIIDTLKEPYREVSQMHFLLGLTAKEIATVLDDNQNTIKSIIRRGKHLIFQKFRSAHGVANETK